MVKSISKSDSFAMILLAYLSLFLLGISDNIRGPLYPEIRTHFQLSDSLGSLFFATSSAMAIPGGYLGGALIHRLGSLKSLRLAAMLMALGLFGVVVAPHFYFVLLAKAFFGFSLGVLGVVQNVIVLECAPASKVSKLQNGLHSMYGMASFTAPLLVSALFQSTGNWRHSFFAICLLALAFFTLTFLAQDRQTIPSTDETPTHLVVSGKEKYFFTLLLAAYVASEVMVSSRMAQFCREFLSMDLTQTAKLNSLFFLFLFSGRLLFVFWSPNLRFKWQMLACLWAGIICMTLGIIVHPLFLALTGFAFAPFYPIAMTVARQLFPRHLRQVTGLAISLAGLTIILMHLLVGVASDAMGIGKAFWLAPLLSGVAIAMMIAYPRLFGRDIS